VTPLIWSPQSVKDIESIREYIAQDSPAHADLVVRKIVAAVQRLNSFPESGRMVPERNTQKSAKSSCRPTALSVACVEESSRSQPYSEEHETSPSTSDKRSMATRCCRRRPWYREPPRASPRNHSVARPHVHHPARCAGCSPDSAAVAHHHHLRDRIRLRLLRAAMLPLIVRPALTEDAARPPAT